MRFNSVQIFFVATVMGLSKSSVVQSFDSSKNYSITYLSVIFRHGDRTPEHLYPTDPYSIDTFSSIGLGGLTVAGKARTYELGTELRVLYHDFLGEIYLPGMITSRSTDYERTKMSLMLVLSALYPPRNDQIWNPILNWQPIPIQYVPRAEDFLLLSIVICPLFRNEIIKVENEKAHDIEKFRSLIEKLERNTGNNTVTLSDMYQLYHILMAEHAMGLTLPDWTQDIFPKGLLEEAATFRLLQSYSNTKLVRLQIGLLLRNIIDSMSGIANKTLKDVPKLQLFSGHEFNIASILIGLGIFQPHVPEYASAVIFELLLDHENQYYVGIRYYLGIPPISHYHEIQGCHMNPCPLNTFISLMRNLMPISEEAACIR